MRTIPGMTVINPADDVEAKAAVLAMADYVGPTYMRFGRLAAPSSTIRIHISSSLARAYSSVTAMI